MFVRVIPPISYINFFRRYIHACLLRQYHKQICISLRKIKSYKWYNGYDARLGCGRSLVPVSAVSIKYYKIGICCFLANHAVLRCKSKNGLASNQDKIGKNMIFWRKIVIFHTKYTNNFRASLRSAQFFMCASPI